MTQLNLTAESPVPEDTTSKPVYGNKFQRAIRMFSDVFVPSSRFWSQPVCLWVCAVCSHRKPFWVCSA